MRLADSSGPMLSRFRILELISTRQSGMTCSDLAKLTRLSGWYTRSFRASLGTRLRRLWKWGLLLRRMERSYRVRHSRRKGVFVWSITAKGMSRLQWARTRQLV